MSCKSYYFELSSMADHTKERGRLALHFFKDPETPLLVEVRRDEGRWSRYATGTWHCCSEEGCVDDVELTEEEVQWLQAFDKEATDWFDLIRG